MHWTLLPISQFADHARHWQYLVETYCASHPLSDLKFIEPLLSCYGHEDLRLAIAKQDDQIVGMVLLESLPRGKLGVFAPSQSPLCLAVMKPDKQNYKRLIQLLRSWDGFKWLLEMQYCDPDYSSWLQHTNQRAETLPYGNTMTVQLEGEFNDYWNLRSKNLRKNIKRYLNRVEKDSVEMKTRVVTAFDAVADALADYGLLESAGWKGSKGTAIERNNQQGRFYTKVLENFAKTLGTRVFELRMDDKLIASRLTIEQNGMMVILKTTYDEKFSQYAPGRLQLYYLLQYAFQESNLRTIEFYTRASPEQLQWSTHRRMIYHLNVYRFGLVKQCLSAARKLRKPETPN